jgi:hypothetical protein
MPVKLIGYGLNDQGYSLNKESSIFCHVAGYEMAGQEPMYDSARALPFCNHCVKTCLEVKKSCT